MFFFYLLVVDLAAWQQHQTGCAVPGRVSDRRADRKPRQRPTAATAAVTAEPSVVVAVAVPVSLMFVTLELALVEVKTTVSELVPLAAADEKPDREPV